MPLIVPRHRSTDARSVGAVCSKRKAGYTHLNKDGMVDPVEDLNGNGVFDIPRNPPNHFHRLLSLMEVPTRTHRQLGDPLKINRVPGKINLNGVRDPRVLASLIDDRQVISPPERDINNSSSNYTLPPDAFEDLNPTPNNE